MKILWSVLRGFLKPRRNYGWHFCDGKCGLLNHSSGKEALRAANRYGHVWWGKSK